MSAPVRDEKGRLISGVLNPGGRPKLAPHMRSRCRTIVDEKVISAWEEEVDERGTHWVRCSELLAAYGYGRPEAWAGNDDGNATPRRPLTDEEREALARLALSSERQSDGGSGSVN